MTEEKIAVRVESLEQWSALTKKFGLEWEESYSKVLWEVDYNDLCIRLWPQSHFFSKNGYSSASFYYSEGYKIISFEQAMQLTLSQSNPRH